MAGSDDRPTARLDSRDMVVTWPIVIASLEKLGDWAIFALRLGILTLIKECSIEMADRNASADLVARMRTLVEALAHMPWDK